MSIPASFLDELRHRTSLAELIGRRVPLTRAGRDLKACCPFHKEKTPSFHVNEQKGFYHCFGCGEHGDAVGFLMKHDRMSFREAVEQLASEAGLTVPEQSREQVEAEVERKNLYQLFESACRWFSAQLAKPHGRNALDYLTSRGLAESTVGRFRLGYAPSDSSLLLNQLKGEGFDEAQLLESGLMRKSEEGRSYSFFRDRVMFPVTDKRGRVVAFGARLMQGDGPKYINSSEHPLFQKGRMLYGLAGAAPAIAKGKLPLVAEGYMDVIRLVEAGFEGAVAPLGTALTEDQIQELWRVGRTGGDPVLCFDGDTAGQRAAVRAMERILPLLGPDRSVRIAFMPSGEDPDSLIRNKGQGAMEEVLQGTISAFEMLWRMEAGGRDLTAPEARAGLEKALLARIKLIQDEGVQGHYRQALQDRIRAEFGWKPRQKGVFGQTKAGRLLTRPLDGQEMGQMMVLAALINHPSLLSIVEEWLMRVPLVAALDKVAQAVVHTLENQPDLTSAEVIEQLKAGGHDEILERILADKTYRLAPWARSGSSAAVAGEQLKGVFSTAHLKSVQAEMPELKQQLAQNWDDTTHARIVASREEIAAAQAATLPDVKPDTE